MKTSEPERQLARHVAHLISTAREWQRRASLTKNATDQRALWDSAQNLNQLIGWYITNIENPASVLRVVAKAVDGKFPDYDDRKEAAWLEAMRTPRGMEISPSFAKYKKELARICGVKPVNLPYADSSLRRTLNRRDHKVSGKPGRPKKLTRI